MRTIVFDLYKRHEGLFRYGVMSVLIVVIEYVSFLAMVQIGLFYLIAVAVSMILSFILNWYFGRAFVFKKRRHTSQTEFLLVAATSLIAVGIQVVAAYVFVSFLFPLPAAAKLFAIVMSFIWSYEIRRRYIY